MSNALLKLCNQLEGLPAIARQVLHVLADEARGYDADCSTLKTAEIAKRTGLSRRTIHRAYVILIEAGHITRFETEPGAALKTKVHPQIGARSPKVDLADGSAGVSYPSDRQSHPQVYKDKTIDHSPLASAREADFSGFLAPASQPMPAPAAPVPPPTPATRELEPVDQVFAAWDAWRDRAGLPGPVTRNAARRVGVAKAIEAQGLGKVLMSIDTVERGVKAGRFRRRNAAGQDDLWATFDALFDVGHARELNLLARLLDGEFGAVAPLKPQTATSNEDRPEDRPSCNDGLQVADPVQRLRAAIGKRIGENPTRAWIDPMMFEWRLGELLAIAPSAFVADWVTSHYLAELRGAAGGAAVRVMVRERVG